MTTPDHMTGAELQTLRDAAGLTRETLAALAGVEPRTVKHWETRKGASVPADVAVIVSHAAWTVINTSRAVLRAAQASHKPGDTVALLRYRKTADMIGGDDMPAWHADAWGAILSRAVLQLMAADYRPRVIWFDPDNYQAWRQSLRFDRQTGSPVEPPEDNAATREAWAAWAIERQAIPHPGDQPPAAYTPTA